MGKHDRTNEKVKEEVDVKQRKTNKKKKHTGLKIFIIILIVLGICGGIFAKKVYDLDGNWLAALFGHNKETLKNLDKLEVLVMGESTGSSDTMIACSYDPKTQKASMLSIPRDTFIGDYKSSATAWDKINSVYQTENGPQKVMKYVSNLTGIDVKYYLMVDTEALKVLVDEIDGVTFNVPIDMNYDDSSQDLHIHLEAGEQLLDGDKAEQVVRFRHNNNGSTYPSEYGQEDIGRMKTQRAFLTALAKKMLSWKSVTKINGILDIAQKYVETNLDFNAIKDYIPYAVEFDINNLKTAALPGVPEYANVVWIYSSDKEETKKVVNKLFFNIDEENSQISSEERSNIKIEVLNGTGDKDEFEKIIDRIETAGYKVKNTGETSKTTRTTIINRNSISETAISEIKNAIKIGNISTGNYSENIDITIILGKDSIEKLED